MPITFKQKCSRCKTNYVTATNRSRYLICYDCQKKELEGPIDDPAMKEMFDIPEEYYKQNSFLRDIKKKYVLYKQLSEKQITAFNKTVEDMKKKQA